MKGLIGREKEIESLQRCYNSNRAEFIVINGRRRVGKTFLINSLYENKFAFSYVGGHHYTKEQQLSRFANALKEYSHSVLDIKLNNWFDAFDALKSYLKSVDNGQRLVIFFDEMPWIDTRKSDFVIALEDFWNSWGAQKANLMLIASGSASSWLNDNLIENKGGLHGRITKQIVLYPFTLKEVEQYLQFIGADWDRYQIAQTYMTFGGVPFYLSLLNPSISLVQNIDELYFSNTGNMRYEFEELYSALFTNSELYLSVVRVLAKKRNGMTRSEISDATNLQGNSLTKILRNLERSSFIISYSCFGKKKKDIFYRLSDFYTIFYLSFVENNLSKDHSWWANHINTPVVNSWQGFSFELLCLIHLEEIKKSLGILGIATEASQWRSKESQIDLIIDRADRVINLCEMKFSIDKYEITKDYADKLRDRRLDFKESTQTKKSIVTTFVTTFGVHHGKHSSIVDKDLILDDLFV